MGEGKGQGMGPGEEANERRRGRAKGRGRGILQGWEQGWGDGWARDRGTVDKGQGGSRVKVRDTGGARGERKGEGVEPGLGPGQA